MLPASVIGHVLVLGVTVVGSCLQSPPAESEVQYVSLVRMPAGAPDAGQTSVAPEPPETTAPTAPTPPPAQPDDAMTAPTETPRPTPEKKETPTPDPDRQRQAALESARAEAARRRALARASEQSSGETDEDAGGSNGEADTETTDGDGRWGVSGGDWQATPGAVTYESQVSAIVESNWMPPTWALDSQQELIAVVHIKIGFDGGIRSRQLVQGSGNTQYDASALAAVDKIERLPPPPDGLRTYLLRKGIPLRFNPQSKVE